MENYYIAYTVNDIEKIETATITYKKEISKIEDVKEIEDVIKKKYNYKKVLVLSFSQYKKQRL